MQNSDNTLTIVTGASENHSRPLLNLLFSLDRYEAGTKVVVYDLGLSERTLGILRRQRRHVVPFRFADYPDHVGSDEFRTYAWKPAMVHETLQSDGLPLLYLDAGNLVHERLDRVRHELARTGLYSPTSSATLAQWCHRPKPPEQSPRPQRRRHPLRRPWRQAPVAEPRDSRALGLAMGAMLSDQDGCILPPSAHA